MKLLLVLFLASRAACAVDFASYARDGVIYPLKVLDAAELERFIAHFNKIEKQQTGGHFGAQVVNLHLTDPVLFDLAHHPSIIRLAQNLTGRHADKLRIMSTTVFCKYPTSSNVAAIVGWHQDLTYWELAPREAWTLWLAIDASTVENGALVYDTGMNSAGQMRHVENPEDEANALMAKQSIPPDLLDGAQKVAAELRPGEAAFHDGWTPHMSPRNFGSQRRLGFVVNFITAETELRPFSAKYQGHDEWRKPVLANATHFPPIITTTARAVEEYPGIRSPGQECSAGSDSSTSVASDAPPLRSELLKRNQG